MKKVLSLILCMMILLSAFGSLTAFAEGDAAPTGASGEETLPDTPRIQIVTNDGNGLSLKKADGYVGGTMTVTDTDGTVIFGAGEVKIRGNSTQNLNKKSYTFKFSKKTDVLGMGKAKKWALVANMFDPTLLRNYVAFYSAQTLGLEYTSMCRVVEVWMDGSFRGCYLLVEPVEEGKTRVDIDIESNNGENDFLIERERNHVDEGVTYFTSNGIRFACKEPDEPTDEQAAYIKSTIDDIFAALKSGRRKEIEKKIDVASFAKYYLLNEFVKEVDFDYSSTFFYYKDGKLYAGPAWDYDLSMGNEDVNSSANYAKANKTEDLYCNTMHFYTYLCRHDWFFDKVRAEYLKYSDYLDGIGVQGGLIDTLYAANKRPIDDNFAVAGWHCYAYYPGLNKQPSTVHSVNLSYFKTWCSDRAAWLKGYFTEEIGEYIVGDSDCDGELSVLDATAIQRKLAGIPITQFNWISGDADCDNSVTIFDATDVQRHIADMPVSFVGDRICKKITA